MTNGVFSDFEIDRMNVKFADAESVIAMNCIGSLEEEMTAKAITKKCRGVTIKNIVKGTGEGTLMAGMRPEGSWSVLEPRTECGCLHQAYDE